MKKRLVAFAAWSALTAAACWGAYVWGWYDGLSYHAVVSSMSEAKWSMSAAQSIRQEDPQLALELLDANIGWTALALHDVADAVPTAERGNYEIVMKRLADYRARFGAGARRR